MTPEHARISLALFLGWLVPGLGHYLYGRRAKALFYFSLILFAFVAGMALGEWRDVNMEKFKLYLLAQVWAGGPALAALALTRDLRITADLPFLDAGLLFTAVAGLLNVVVLVDLYEVHLKAKEKLAAAAGAGGPQP
ncbi:MAG: hypothetical protein HY812_10195 [Planctomycetes bacterium]|nr:hypothetical protein [Planctomycetota bacterium]